MSLANVPESVMYMLQEFIVPVPRCIAKMRCTCTFIRDFWLLYICKLVCHRTWIANIHTQTRMGAMNVFAQFACKYGLFSPVCLKNVFRVCFNDDNFCVQGAAIKMLFVLSERYSYKIILNEFMMCDNDKKELC